MQSYSSLTKLSFINKYTNSVLITNSSYYKIRINLSSNALKKNNVIDRDKRQ